jgi:hypothetical protein
VSDLRGERCFIETSPGELTAVELKSGQVSWRMTGLGRPVAATGSRLLTVSHDARGLQLLVIEAHSGVQIAAVPLPMIPNPAGSDILDRLQIEAAEAGHKVRLTWHVQFSYRGGARPSATAVGVPEASGSLLVDPDSATIEIDAAPLRARPEVENAPDLGPHAEATAEVLGMKRMGDRLYSLKMDRSDALLKLEAKDATSGKVQWETDLSQIDDAPPEPQRE